MFLTITPHHIDLHGLVIGSLLFITQKWMSILNTSYVEIYLKCQTSGPSICCSSEATTCDPSSSTGVPGLKSWLCSRISFLRTHSWEAANVSSRGWVPATHVGELNWILSSPLWPSSTLSGEFAWVNSGSLWGLGDHLFLSVCLKRDWETSSWYTLTKAVSNYTCGDMHVCSKTEKSL